MKPCPCLHPKRVYSSYHRDYIYVPCGKCDACVCGKGSRLSERLGESMARFKHRYFVTLTFKDDYLPVAVYNPVIDAFVHPYDCDYNGELYSCSRLVIEESLKDKVFKESFSKYGGVPVLSRRLLINFKKRLRKHFAKIYGKEYLFIYGCGEYGPTTLRPHYHVVLCTNAPITSSILEDCVYKAWSYCDKSSSSSYVPFGKIDFQRIIDYGVRNYVAQYLACSTSLPPCYSGGYFKSFYQSSPLITADSFRFKDSVLETFYNNPAPQQSCVSLIDNSLSLDVVPKGLVNRVFPKCYKFGELSFVDRLSLYSVYSRQPFLNALDFANAVINSFVSFSDCFGLCKELFVDDNIQKSVERLVRHFYLSRRVCLNALRLHVSLSDYVKRIELFWSNYELLKLRNFYELQESLLKSHGTVYIPYLFTLYYDTSDKLRNIDYYINQFNVSPEYHVSDIIEQVNYSSLMSKIVLDTTKTKKRNSYFASKGYKRPNFLFNFKTLKKCRMFSQV